MPSIFDSGRKESAARDLDVETGVSKERGRLPGIGDAHEGRSDGERAAISSGGAEACRAVEGADESTEKRAVEDADEHAGRGALSATKKRTQRKYKAMARARGEVWEEG